MVREVGVHGLDPELVEAPVRDLERLRRRAILLRELSRARTIKHRLTNLPSTRRVALRREFPY